MMGERNQQAFAQLTEHDIDAADDLGIKTAADVARQHANQSGFSPGQRPGKQIRAVVCFVNHPHHPRARFF